MKNILLVGASRAGKTTFTKMVSKEYQIIDGDTIREAYKIVINKDTSLCSHEVGQLEEYQKFIIEVFKRYIKYNKDLRYILDTVDIVPSQIDLFDAKDTLMIVFGYPNAKAEDVVAMQRKYDTCDDWTFSLSEQELLDNATYWIKRSKEYERECKRLNIKFVDTSRNCQEVLCELLDWLRKWNSLK